MTAPFDPDRLLDVLLAHQVEFIIVGASAAVLQGAPVRTADLDIVHLRTDVNVARLLAALQSIDAHARLRPDRRIAPSASHLLGEGHILLSTALGPLDVLGTLEPGVGYAELLPDSVRVELDGRVVRALSLERLIRAKRAANRAKDLAVLPVLEATLDEVRKRK